MRAHILELVLELDLLGDGDAVLGDARGAEALVEDDVAALGAERHLDRVGEDVDAAHDPLTGVARKAYVFRCHVFSSFSFVAPLRKQEPSPSKNLGSCFRRSPKAQ